MKDFKKSARSSAGPRTGGFSRGGSSRPSFGARGASAGYRAARDASRGFDVPKEMHQATCNKCREACEVPFRPNGKKPVYCRNCFVRDDAPQGGFEKRGFDARGDSRSFGAERFERSSVPSQPASDPRIAAIQKELSQVHALLEELIANVKSQAD